jgi:phage FluMu gp28-like protein
LEVKPELVEMNKLNISLSNGSMVLALPSREGNVRGFTANLVIEDEAARIDDSVHVALRPMLSVSRGRYIMASTPGGARGHFWETWVKGEDWQKVEVTAFDCPRIDPSFLKQERIALGERLFAQEYLCQFTEASEQLFASDLVDAAITDEVTPLIWR